MYWCDVCQTRRTDDDLDTDRRGRPCCPKCGTHLNSQSEAGHV